MDFSLLMHRIQSASLGPHMMRRLAALHYDEAAAAQLQATVEAERAHVQRCRDHADQLSTTLASALRLSLLIISIGITVKSPMQTFSKLPQLLFAIGAMRSIAGTMQTSCHPRK